MKKVYLLFLPTFSLCVFATLAFINNVYSIVAWWRAFIASGGDSSAMENVSGCMPFLDWSAVDYSAVTTFIPMTGLWCMCFALVSIMRRRRSAAGDFPFFKGSDQLYVALGLFGTLWGIIVIGYFDLATVTMGDLMQCLHTALFSTLTAVVWVFMIDRPLVRPLFTRLLEETSLVESDHDDLSAAVDGLVARLGAASDAFDRRQKEYEESFSMRQKAYEESFKRHFETYEESLESRHRAYSERFDSLLENLEKACERRRAVFEEAFEKRLAEYENLFDLRQKEYTEFFRRRIDELERRAAEEKSRAESSNAKLAAVVNALR